MAYASPELRPALDAWDTGAVTPEDIRRWCLVIEKGGSNSSRFDPAEVAARVSNRSQAYARERRVLDALEAKKIWKKNQSER
jgi:hypothetical protein